MACRELDRSNGSWLDILQLGRVTGHTNLGLGGCWLVGWIDGSCRAGTKLATYSEFGRGFLRTNDDRVTGDHMASLPVFIPPQAKNGGYKKINKTLCRRIVRCSFVERRKYESVGGGSRPTELEGD